jgi:glycosyltransferase involved in cell wall biosynthesis
MKKFKLIQILPSLRSGGVEQGTLDVANYLASLDIKNYICSNGGQMLSYLNKKNVTHFKLPVHSKFFFTIPFVATKINTILKENDINILHFRSRAPSWLLPFLNKKNIKTVSTFHNVYGNQNFFKRIYNSQLGKVEKIVAISNYVKHEIINNYNLNEKKITVINRGIDTDYFDSGVIKEENLIRFIKKYNIDLEKKIILYPGRLTSWKGQIEFLNIIEYFKDESIMFYFVGDDKNKSYLENFKKKINKKNLNTKCKILGHFNKEELKIMYFCANLIISAPLRPEGFGRTISESLSMKKIILAYNIGGVKDQLASLDEIYKIENQDDSEMISKIKIVLNLDENHILNLGNIARNHVINHFSKKNMLNSYFNFYQEL